MLLMKCDPAEGLPPALMTARTEYSGLTACRPSILGTQSCSEVCGMEVSNTIVFKPLGSTMPPLEGTQDSLVAANGANARKHSM